MSVANHKWPVLMEASNICCNICNKKWLHIFQNVFISIKRIVIEKVMLGYTFSLYIPM